MQYYRQEGAKSTFRSVREVVRYIMYEEEPAKKKGKEQKQGEDGSEINHYNGSRVRKSHPTNMEIGCPSPLMNCDDFTIDDVDIIADDERLCFHHNAPDQELRANAHFTTYDDPMVADGQISDLGDDLCTIIGDLNSDWVDENLMLPSCEKRCWLSPTKQDKM
ncbi:unnamed protein product [Prunus armeniaca]|uniref:Uncharacterized protein n=1 Tax=Prunus armeniaca TaxID=36596 RepID=A0A6J5U2K1_PRUAR|nr:unnamed protein product [Prunus armeniaca]CAB4300818.1 unnamed protein product [Prunus armeniaca]